MLLFAPALLLLLLLAAPTPSATQELQVRGQRTPGDATQDAVKVVISGGCASHGGSSDGPGGEEFHLAPGSPLVLTHQIKLVPSGSGSGSRVCGCESDLAALLERLERLEREVSVLREKCGGEGGCCSSEESKGAGCSIRPKEDGCPNDCSDQGRCVGGACQCFPGFSGPDCSHSDCPGNCHDSGRCVDGQCVCNPGSGGPDCSQRACPDDCRGHGRCVDGACVCEDGFTGDDCSEAACPGQCTDRGRCVNGECVCREGFTGADCGEKTCRNNCSGRGRCVHGKCVCSVGFSGPDCSAKGCANNCTDRGRCVKGKCVCRHGFRGPDCSLCEDGMTGPSCETVMSAVSHLRTQEVTETSVTLLWTPPIVQYDTYYVTFSSQKDGDQPITAQVGGGLSSFTQTGLAAGQEYSATITGEVGGRRGAESATEFTTLIPSPTNLRVVKTTSTSAIVQWDKSQGEIDRYRLSIVPSDGAGETQEITGPFDQDSAHIGQLEAGRSYDIILIAEKGASQSQPVTTQAVPGNSLPAGTTQGPLAQSNFNQELHSSPAVPVSDQQGGTHNKPEVDSVQVGDIGGPDNDLSRPKHRDRLMLYRKPKVPGPFRLNTTRVVPGGTVVGRGPWKRLLMGEKKKAPVVPKKSKASVSKTGSRTRDENVTEPQTEASRSDRGGGEHPAVTSGPGSEPHTQRSSEDQNRLTDVSVSGQENHSAPVSSERTGTSPSQEKRCLNKVRVTHTRLPHKDKGSGCGGGVTVIVGDASDSETDLDHSPDPLQKLLKDTYDSLNITTFSVHLSKSADLSDDEDTIRRQIFSGLKPLSSFSSSSSSLPRPQSSSSPPPPSHTPSSSSSSSSSSSLSPPSSSSPSPSHSTPSSSSSSSLSLPSSSSSSLSPPSSSSPSTSLSTPSSSSSSSLSPPSSSLSSDKPDSLRNHVLKAAEKTTDLSHPVERTGPLLRPTPPKRGFIRRPRPDLGLVPNRTRMNLRGPPHPPPHSNVIPRGESEKRDTSTNGSSSPSALEESSPVKTNTLGRDASRDMDGPAPPQSSGQNQNIVQTERQRTPVRRRPPPGGYMRRPLPNMRVLMNQTRPHFRPMIHLIPPSKSQRGDMSPAGFPATPSPPDVKDLAESKEPVREDEEDRSAIRTSSTRMSSELNQTLRGTRPTKIHSAHPHTFSGPPQDKTSPHMRRPQHPRAGLLQRPLPVRKLTGDAAGSQTSQQEKGSSSDFPEVLNNNQLGERDVPRPSQGGEVPIRRTGEEESATVRALMDGPNTVSPQTKGEQSLTKTNTYGENKPTTTVSKKDQLDSASAGPTSQNSRTVSLPRRPPPSKNTTGHGTHVREAEPETSPPDSQTGQTTAAASKRSMGPVSREHLDYVGVTNRTSDGFTLVWDSPEGKYKNFVVTRKRNEKDKTRNERRSQTDERRRQEDTGTQEGKNPPPADDDNRESESGVTHIPRKQSSSGSEGSFTGVLHGSARSLHFEDLPPQTEYTITLLGRGPGLLSRLHKLVISTGPEPPTDIVFSELTENSVTVSWTKPKNPVSGFKVTYTHAEDGEPVSVSLDSDNSSVGLSQLSPGSTYEVSILSILGQDESDPLHSLVSTLPDPPTHLRAVNVTDTKALLLWRPALATVDKYAIIYGSGSGSETRVTVSGNTAEQQLSGLEESTTYTVTISSQLGVGQSSPSSTSFTTSRGGDGGVPRDLQANAVTPRSALLSWKPPVTPAARYRLTYETEGQEVKGVLLDPWVTELSLTRLYPGSKYTVQLQAEAGGQFASTISTEFTTGALRFPFPNDCSQELLNGVRTSGQVEVFPQGPRGPTMMVYCDMETDGGGWTVFQRRKDGSVDFFKGWREYVKGFGDLSGEFWFGLEKLHSLTSATRMSLRVDLRDGGDSVFAKYSTFEVSRKNYKLTVGGYSGDAGDSLSYHNNCVFSTKDRDPSPFITRCALSYHGGWWYRNCHEANLNGLYGIDVKHQGIIWTSWKGKDTSIAFTEMKMRPASFSPAE